MRLMGKRQLGEMQPYELAITLVVSDLACMPMSDPSIPFIYGILPMLALLITHVALTFVGQKSQRFRKLVNGKPIIVISEGNIDVKALGHVILRRTGEAGFPATRRKGQRRTARKIERTN